jgi:predicted RNase H-like HicB family nuclease
VEQLVNIVCWEEESAWLGYLQEYPDCWTQGETLENLKEHLRDLYEDITSGQIPGIRKVHAPGSAIVNKVRRLRLQA